MIRPSSALTRKAIEHSESPVVVRDVISVVTWFMVSAVGWLMIAEPEQWCATAGFMVSVQRSEARNEVLADP
jgi:hypothetical protein